MDLIGRKIISDDGLGVRELILEMQECVEAPSLSKLISMSQIDRFKKSLDDLEETVSIITKNSDDKEFTGKIAFDTLMMIGTISAAWQMLLSVERASSAFKNNTSSSEFLKEKTETAKHYLDFIMPRYLSNFSTISACTN